VRSKVENDIYVALVKPQVQACAIKVEEPPKVAPLHEVTQLMDGCVVLESVAWHEHHADGVSGLDERPCFICRGGHRFFDKYMLACGDCLQAKLGMAGWRCGDYERINMRQGIVDVGVYGNAVICLLLSAIDLGKPLVHADDCRYPGRGPQHAYVPRAPITYSNDADANSVWPH
jgi:hypothetical protein